MANGVSIKTKLQAVLFGNLAIEKQYGTDHNERHIAHETRAKMQTYYDPYQKTQKHMFINLHRLHPLRITVFDSY